MAFGLAESCITERSGRRNGNRNGLVRTIDGEIPRASHRVAREVPLIATLAAPSNRPLKLRVHGRASPRQP